jgi:protein involved in temperature-dependent protein secretion
MMRNTRAFSVVLLLAGLSATPLIAQEPADAFKTAYAAAEVANKKAGNLRNQWTVTSASLAAAKKAADGGDYETATRLAKQAESLANASIAQTEREKSLWKDSEIR